MYGVPEEAMKADHTIEETVIQKKQTVFSYDQEKAHNKTELMMCEPKDREHCESFLFGKGCKHLKRCWG